MATATITAEISIQNSKEEDENERKLKNILKNADKIASEINEILARDQYDHAKQITRDAVDAFYGSFSSSSNRPYRRHGNDGAGGLYDAYDFGIVNGEDFWFALGPEFMSANYHQGPEFVYENSFVRGYHGGSGGTNAKGVTKDSPWWKVGPAFIDWFEPAPQSDSPHDAIVDAWNAYIDGEFPRIQAETVLNVLSKYWR